MPYLAFALYLSNGNVKGMEHINSTRLGLLNKASHELINALLARAQTWSVAGDQMGKHGRIIKGLGNGNDFVEGFGAGFFIDPCGGVAAMQDFVTAIGVMAQGNLSDHAMFGIDIIDSLQALV